MDHVRIHAPPAQGVEMARDDHVPVELTLDVALPLAAERAAERRPLEQQIHGGGEVPVVVEVEAAVAVEAVLTGDRALAVHQGRRPGEPRLHHDDGEALVNRGLAEREGAGIGIPLVLLRHEAEIEHRGLGSRRRRDRALADQDEAKIRPPLTPVPGEHLDQQRDVLADVLATGVEQIRPEAVLGPEALAVRLGALVDAGGREGRRARPERVEPAGELHLGARVEEHPADAAEHVGVDAQVRVALVVQRGNQRGALGIDGRAGPRRAEHVRREHQEIAPGLSADEVAQRIAVDHLAHEDLLLVEADGQARHQPGIDPVERRRVARPHREAPDGDAVHDVQSRRQLVDAPVAAELARARGQHLDVEAGAVTEHLGRPPDRRLRAARGLKPVPGDDEGQLHGASGGRRPTTA
jgi:hypothetical protein